MVQIMLRKALSVVALGMLVCVCCCEAESKVPSDSGDTVGTDAGPLSDGPGVRDDIQRKLLQDGFRINGFRAKLVRLPKSTRWFLVFDEPRIGAQVKNLPEDSQAEVLDPLSVPIEVLPGRYLTAMTEVTANKVDTSVTFRVWGRFTTYHRRNFVLPTLVATLSYFGEQAGGKDDEPRTLLSKMSSPDARSKIAGPGRAAQRDDSGLSNELREALLAIPRTTPLAVRSDLEETRDDEARPRRGRETVRRKKPKPFSGAAAKVLRDGDMIVDRIGRMIYDGEDKRWLFVFEADGVSLNEAPIVLHRSRLLQVMEKKVTQSSQRFRFRVSGEITTFKGDTYMLLHKVLQVYDSGNLHK